MTFRPGQTPVSGLRLGDVQTISHKILQASDLVPIGAKKIRTPGKGWPDRIYWRAIPDETGHW